MPEQEPPQFDPDEPIDEPIDELRRQGYRRRLYHDQLIGKLNSYPFSQGRRLDPRS